MLAGTNQRGCGRCIGHLMQPYGQAGLIVFLEYGNRQVFGCGKSTFKDRDPLSQSGKVNGEIPGLNGRQAHVRNKQLGKLFHEIAKIPGRGYKAGDRFVPQAKFVREKGIQPGNQGVSQGTVRRQLDRIDAMNFGIAPQSPFQNQF